MSKFRYILQIQYMYYNPWKEPRFGAKAEEATFHEQGYVRTEESATCMVRTKENVWECLEKQMNASFDTPKECYLRFFVQTMEFFKNIHLRHIEKN